ncbi:MAG: FHA domain-containing protein [Candidatus Omnitrophica bacterium]|nr:FHA domain-containing protein [Candidatus Omnitrophota bacterium]MCA9435774.1 FHA domain-containing protein [Candidatus Omnitrophota bacterium]MCB9770189.1 FHA domain-containing protein [Candidatus Omnitrophota bacterium]
MTPPSVKGERVPVLVILTGKDENRHFPINQPESVIGRDTRADLPLDDSKVSRRHSKVLYSNLGQTGEIPDCRILDLGSTNGTFLNGEEVLDEDGVWLQDRDRIQIGNTILGYFLMDQDAISLT